MGEIVGGLRYRLVRESVYQTIKQGLTDLGWFEAGRSHLPIALEPHGQNMEDTIVLNTAALSDEAARETGWELGSYLTEETWQMYVDFYAENDALGLQFISDVRDILRGRFDESTGRSGPTIIIYDWRAATPIPLFYVDIEKVDIVKAHGFLKPWLQHWYAVSFNVCDAYATESDDPIFWDGTNTVDTIDWG